ncbi:hypothetical protein, partial [Adlercreutzia rubneri]
MATEEFDNAAELCAAILIRGTNSQVKRGLGREYIDHTDALSTLRGKFEIILLCRLWARRRTPHRLNWATSRRSPCIGAFSGCALPDPTRTPPFPSC